MLSTFARAPILASRLLAQRPLLSSTSLGSRLYSTPTSTSAPPTGLSEGERTIWSKLHKQFSPTELEVQDVSGGCGSFYAISVTSSAFKGLPMIKQHRLVNDALKQEIEGIHGLQLKTNAI